MGKIILGGIIGAIVVFAWMFVSYMVLPWHEIGVHQFKNEAMVAKTIQQNTIESGVYMYPHCNSAETEEACQDLMTKGPVIYAQVRKNGIDPMSPHLYIVSFIEGLIGAAFVSFLLVNLRSGVGYLKRVYVSGLFGLVAGILGSVWMWNWFGAGGDYTLVMILDGLIGYLLAGIVIAGFVKPKPAI